MKRNTTRPFMVEVTPDRLTARGEAVVEGRPSLLVWGGLPGEPSRVKVVEVGNNRDYGLWQSSPQPDPHRVNPPCPKWSACGGCPLMHLDAVGQGDARVRMLRDSLAKSAIEVDVDPLVEGPDGGRQFRYVSKLIAGYSDYGRPKLGAPGRHDRRVVPIPECLVVSPGLLRVAGRAAHHMLELEIRPFDPANGGLLRHVVARQSRATSEILITLVATRENGLIRQYAEALAGDDVSGVHLHMNSEPGNAIFSRDEEGRIGTRKLLGNRTITEELADVEYLVGPTDFFQTNPGVADRLYRDVLRLSGAARDVPVIDLYCGVGGFALAMADTTGWAMGVEVLDSAVQRARESASLGKIPAEFLSGPVLESLPQVAKRVSGRRPIVVANPARRGLEDGVLDAIVALNPRRLVYVSCSPRNLGKDLGELIRRGWTVNTVRPYDMFPHTPHLEVVAVVDPPDGGEVGADVRGPRRRVVG